MVAASLSIFTELNFFVLSPQTVFLPPPPTLGLLSVLIGYSVPVPVPSTTDLFCLPTTLLLLHKVLDCVHHQLPRRLDPGLSCFPVCMVQSTAAPRGSGLEGTYHSPGHFPSRFNFSFFLFHSSSSFSFCLSALLRGAHICPAPSADIS